MFQTEDKIIKEKLSAKEKGWESEGKPVGWKKLRRLRWFF